MLADLSDDNLATIATHLQLLRDVVLFARTCTRHATLLRPTIATVRDGPAAAAQRLHVDHLAKEVVILGRQVNLFVRAASTDALRSRRARSFERGDGRSPVSARLLKPRPLTFA
eukprot:230378-Prymnesium_polylepis.1